MFFNVSTEPYRLAEIKSCNNVQTENDQEILSKKNWNPKQTEIKINDYIKHKDNRYWFEWLNQS